jgi:anti-sigma regulatory factor (Ser/Thr protein kinase)
MQRVDRESRHSDELTHFVRAGLDGAVAADEPSSPPPSPRDALRLTLDADPMALVGLRARVGAWLSFHGVAAQDRFDVTLATSEAAGNSIEHAYGAHKATLTVTCERDSEQVRITVRDNGQWRDGGAYGRGRGLAIMRASVDSVQITRGAGGTTVVLTKRCAPSGRDGGRTPDR